MDRDDNLSILLQLRRAAESTCRTRHRQQRRALRNRRIRRRLRSLCQLWIRLWRGVFVDAPALPGGVWTEQTLYTFQGGNEDGAVPLTGLAIGKNGELFGTTYAGGPSSTCSGLTYYGASGCGTVFELLPPATAGGAWTESVLYSFTGGSDGGFPNAVTYRDGMLYGTFAFGGDLAACGGVGCGGVCFSSARALRGVAWAETVLYSFIGERDGLFPAAGVTVGKHGELFGTTHARRRFEELPRKPGLRCRVRADATLGSGQSLA